jgi:hypothetical protein
MAKERDKNLYLKQYPEAKKWFYQCVICQSIGFNPEMPEKIYPGVLAENIRSYFSPLEVHDLSICNECAQYLKK